MKSILIFFCATVFLAACSSPKYTYHFDHYDYHSGKRTGEIIRDTNDQEAPLELSKESLTASTENIPVIVDKEEKKQSLPSITAMAEKYKAMSKDGKREFRKELKKEIKSYVKKEGRQKNDVASIKATKAFDATVSLAILFGAAGIILTVLAGISNVFWILGAISLVIGAVFFIQWVANGNG